MAVASVNFLRQSKENPAVASGSAQFSPNDADSLLADAREFRWIAADRRPLHEALVAGGVEGCGAVEDAAVVPDDQVAILPFVAVAELGLGDVIQQLLQERAAVLHRHAHDVGGVRPEEECLAPVHRARPDHRVADRRILGTLFLGEKSGPDLVA